MYPYSFESNEWRINWNQSFLVDPHLLECLVVEDVNRAPIVHQDLVGVVVSDPNTNHERIIIRVVEMPGIFLCKSNDRAVDLGHLQDESHQLDVLNHS